MKRPGRPPRPEHERLTERVEVRMTRSDRVKLKQLGGTGWIRRAIRKARIATDPQHPPGA